MFFSLFLGHECETGIAIYIFVCLFSEVLSLHFAILGMTHNLTI